LLGFGAAALFGGIGVLVAQPFTIGVEPNARGARIAASARF